MEHKFPLYDILLQKAKDIDVKDFGISKLCSSARKMTKEHAELVYALILHHNSGKEIFAQIPYGGKVMTGGKGVTFHLSVFPLELQAIIIAYIKMTNEKLEN